MKKLVALLFVVMFVAAASIGCDSNATTKSGSTSSASSSGSTSSSKP